MRKTINRKLFALLVGTTMLTTTYGAMEVEASKDTVGNSSVTAGISTYFDISMSKEEIEEGIEALTASAKDSFVPTETAADKVEQADGTLHLEEVVHEEVSGSMTVALASNAVNCVSGVLSEANLWGYTNLGIAHVDNNLNIRELPEEGAKLVGKLPKDCACEIESVENGWAKIKSGKVSGYVSTEFLYMGKEAIQKAKEIVSLLATVQVETLFVREEPNTDCPIITLVPKAEELEAIQIMDNGWVEILIDDEKAYVSGEFVVVEEKLQTAVSMTELLYGQGVSNVRVDLCQYAKQFVGNPYVWGGTSLTKGADCSGFTLSIYKKYGISLPHHAASQAKLGKSIKLSEAKPGDLVFYAKNGSINHVAIYLGGGQVVHASSPKTGIKISNVSYRTPAKICTYLK